MKRKTSDCEDLPLITLKQDDSETSENDLPLIALKSHNEYSYKSLLEESPERCEFCDKMFSTRFENIKHNATHIIIPLLKLTLHQCDECLFHFTSLQDLETHITTKKHKTSQFKLSPKNSTEYEEILQSIVRKQVVVKCHDALNEVLRLTVKASPEQPKVLSPKKQTSDMTGSPVKVSTENVKLKDIVKLEIYEISDSDTEVKKEEESEKEENSHRELSSPVEPLHSRIVFEDDFDDDLFEAEEILPDKPYQPTRNTYIIGGVANSNFTNSNNIIVNSKTPYFNTNIMTNSNDKKRSNTNENINKSHLKTSNIITNSHKSHKIPTNTKSELNKTNDIFSNLNTSNIIANSNKTHIKPSNITANSNKTHINPSNISNSKSTHPSNSLIPSNTTHKDLSIKDIIKPLNGLNSNKFIEKEIYKSIHYKDLVVPELCDCRYCGLCFPNRFGLIKHETTHMKARPTHPVFCYVCEKYLSGNHWSLKRHLQTFHPTQERKLDVHKCHICNFKYHNYEKHYKRYHQAVCKVCKRRFERKFIQSHICYNACDSVTERVMKMCEMCLSFCKNKTNLHYEVLGDHSEIGMRQECDRCHSKYFEVRIVKRKVKFREMGDGKRKKPISNEERLKKMQNRFKMVKKMNKL